MKATSANWREKQISTCILISNYRKRCPQIKEISFWTCIFHYSESWTKHEKGADEHNFCDLSVWERFIIFFYIAGSSTRVWLYASEYFDWTAIELSPYYIALLPRFQRKIFWPPISVSGAFTFRKEADPSDLSAYTLNSRLSDTVFSWRNTTTISVWFRSTFQVIIASIFCPSYTEHIYFNL